MYRSVLITCLSLVLLLFSACDETSQDVEPEPEILEFATEPSDDLTQMVEETPSDFTWEFFSDNLIASLIPGIDWSGKIVLSSLQISDGEVVNRSTTPSVSVNTDEFTAGLSTEELFPGLVYVPGNEWGTQKRWKQMNNTQWPQFKKWIKLDQWMPKSQWVEGIKGSLSEIEKTVLNEVDLSEKQTLVIVYAHPAANSTDREVTTQPYGIVFAQE